MVELLTVIGLATLLGLSAFNLAVLMMTAFYLIAKER